VRASNQLAARRSRLRGPTIASSPDVAARVAALARRARPLPSPPPTEPVEASGSTSFARGEQGSRACAQGAGAGGAALTFPRRACRRHPPLLGVRWVRP
jgi:hypothetical protein